MGSINVTSSAATGVAGDVALSFGGAGFLIFYFLGVVDVLNKLGVVNGSSKFAGCSSGAIISTCQCAGVSTPEVYKAALTLAHECRSQMFCSGTLDKHLSKLLESTFPQDAYKRCSGRGFVAISTGQLLLNNHHPLLISEFTDNKDLINAASSSSFIPLWSDKTMVKHFRGLPVYDGAFANNQPCPPGVKTCVKISISSPAWPKRSPVETFMNRLANNGPKAMVSQAIKPDPTIRSWPPAVPSGNNGPDTAMLQLAAGKNVDIAPGIFHKVPFTQQEWYEFALTPPDDGTLKFIFELGQADAAAWARHTGRATQGTPASSQQPAGGRKLLTAAGRATTH